MDLSKYLSPEDVVVNDAASTAAGMGADAVAADGGKVEYELFSVMIHSGGTFGGHYYAYIKYAPHRFPHQAFAPAV